MRVTAPQARAVVLALLLAVAGALAVIGVAMLSVPAAWILAGALLAGWALLTLAEVGG